MLKNVRMTENYEINPQEFFHISRFRYSQFLNADYRYWYYRTYNIIKIKAYKNV